MPTATLLSAGLKGIEAFPIHVEVDYQGQQPKWITVGLAESAVKEAKERVLSAIFNSGYEFSFRRITLNLAPANIKKNGTAFDLPIAVGLMGAAGLVPSSGFKNYLLVGELSLKGTLRPVRGILSVAILAKQLGLKGMICPQENVHEALPLQGIEILGAADLPSVVEFFHGRVPLKSPARRPLPQPAPDPLLPDFSEVRGQDQAKRALEVTAAGFHNLLMVGPPGTGKSMLAQRLPSILPDMNFTEQLTTTRIYSLLGLLTPEEGLMRQRPFRSPHHTISDAGLIGGGTHPRPGEVSLAHNGVLFLDELTEFKKNVLESLRQPLEARRVTISRALESITYPARFLLAAAMNPCPCGKLGHPQNSCFCPPGAIQRYRAKISGPLLDRIDLQVHVPSISFEEMSQKSQGEPSAKKLERILAAQEIQQRRLHEEKLCFNSEMGPKEIRRFCIVQEEAEKILALAVKKWGMSARGYHRVLKVARTIADLEGVEKIDAIHISEAIGYRTLENPLFSYPK